MWSSIIRVRAGAALLELYFTYLWRKANQAGEVEVAGVLKYS